jgi:hypothetical protein
MRLKEILIDGRRYAVDNLEAVEDIGAVRLFVSSVTNERMEFLLFENRSAASDAIVWHLTNIAMDSPVDFILLIGRIDEIDFDKLSEQEVIQLIANNPALYFSSKFKREFKAEIPKESLEDWSKTMNDFDSPENLICYRIR